MTSQKKRTRRTGTTYASKLQVMLTDEQYDKFQEECNFIGVQMSVFVRSLILREGRNIRQKMENNDTSL